MVPTSYYDFFTAVATVAGALIGLLFVAISISPAKLSGRNAEVDHQVRAATAFSGLVNTLVISLVALLPGNSLGLPVNILAASGLSSTVGLIVLLLRDSKMRLRLDRLLLPAVLVLLYCLQLTAGIALSEAPGNRGDLGNLGGLCIGFCGFAIARAWTLVGARNASLIATVVEMVRESAGPDAVAERGAETGEAPAPK